MRAPSSNKLLEDLTSSPLYGEDKDFSTIASDFSRLVRTAQVDDMADAGGQSTLISVYNMMTFSKAFREKVLRISDLVGRHILMAYDDSKGSFVTDPEVLSGKVTNWMMEDADLFNHAYVCHRMALRLPNIVLDPVAQLLKPYLNKQVVMRFEAYLHQAGGPTAVPLWSSIEAEMQIKLPLIQAQVLAELEGGRTETEKAQLMSRVEGFINAGINNGSAELRILAKDLKVEDVRAEKIIKDTHSFGVKGMKKYITPNRYYAVRDPENDWKSVATGVFVLVCIARMNVIDKAQKVIKNKIETLSAIFPDWRRLPPLSDLKQAIGYDAYGMSSATAGKVLALLHEKAKAAVKAAMDDYVKEHGGLAMNEPLYQVFKNLGNNILVNPTAIERVTGVNTLGSHMYADMLLKKAAESKADPAYLADALMQRIEGWAAYSGGQDKGEMKFVDLPEVPGAEGEQGEQGGQAMQAHQSQPGQPSPAVPLPVGRAIPDDQILDKAKSVQQDTEYYKGLQPYLLRVCNGDQKAMQEFNKSLPGWKMPDYQRLYEVLYVDRDQAKWKGPGAVPPKASDIRKQKTQQQEQALKSKAGIWRDSQTLSLASVVMNKLYAIYARRH